MTTSTQPPGSPRAAHRGQCWCWGGAGISLRTPGLPPGAHCPHRGPPAEGGRELPEAGRSQGLLHRCGHGLPGGARARGAVCAGHAGRAGLPRTEPPRRHPFRHAGPQRPGYTLARAGELPELRATDFVSAAQPDGQQRLPGGGVLAARPRARVVFQPLLGSQVRAGRFLHLSAAGAGRTGRERGRHRVRLGASRSRLSGRGSPGCHKGQGGPWAQGGPGRDSWWCHSGPRSLLPTAPPPALPAPGVAAAPKGLVHPPGAQRHGRRCCLSSGGWCSFIFPEETSIQPSESRDANPDTSKKVATPQDRVIGTEKESREKLPACGNHHTSGCGRATVCQAPCQGLGIMSVSAILDDTIAPSIFQMRKLRLGEVV
nr:hydroxysteroid 11-beta-dehydrogenase 1-like protein isoform X4 [Manis javanica]XP_036874358.1 hydroxysteroid 11-beta-dehydrogenase 1-like protein isoform X4 [Manis javanica]XP_036874359.1 hydroxysteroid 11-beta-dehydrogenase 1-like protein isoform X4 [Manis javanica]XP_036874360.1 hydroxysteroid 11-beta-dehydrogenase 1-like protein isoform X4 [Manis javanica]XP_036874361.1 hydroxysteroid 11-beta-dehydrogenase 1-like protein isoform X4 [Manis javanica]